MIVEYILFCCTYKTGLEQYKLWKVPAAIGSIMVFGALTYALLQSVWNLKAILMNV